MASNTRPQFRHPLPTMAKSAEELSWITEEMLIKAVTPDKGLRQLNWHGLKVIVRRMISLEEMQRLVDVVWSLCWDGDRLCVELCDFQLKCAVITFFTNVTLPEDAAAQYEYLYGTDLYETVTPYISQSQLAEIQDALRTLMSR